MPLRRLMSFALCVGLLVLAIGVGYLRAARETRLHVERMRKTLRRTEITFSPKRFFGREARALLSRTMGREMGRDLAREILRWRRGLPGTRTEVYLFDGQGRLFDPKPLGYTHPETIRVRIEAGKFSDIPFATYWEGYLTSLRPTFRENRGLFGPICQREVTIHHRLQGRPRRIGEFGAENRAMGRFAMWDFVPGAPDGQVAGVVVIFSFFRSWQAELDRVTAVTLRRRGERVSFWCAENPKRSLLGARESLQHLAALAGRFFHRMGQVLETRDDVAVFHLCSSESVLIGRVPRAFPRIDPGLLLLAIAGFALLLRLHMVGFLDRPPVWLFTLVLVIGSAGVPILLSGLFWVHFRENRNRALFLEAQSRLETFLVTVDRAFFTVLEQQRATYNGLFYRLQEIYRSGGFSLKPRGDVGRDKIMLVPTRPGDFSLWREEVWKRERNREFDMVFLVSSAAAILNDTSFERGGVRKILQFRGKIRQDYLESLYSRGHWVPWPVRDFIMDYPDEEYRATEWYRIDGVLDDRKARMVGQSVAELLARFNEKSGLVPSRPGLTSNAMGLVLDSMEEFFGLSLETWLHSSFGEMATFQKMDSRTATWMHPLSGPSGIGEYFLAFHHQPTTLEQLYLERLFRGARRLPEGIRLFALGIPPAARNFPRPFLDRALEPFVDRIVSPRLSWAGVVERKGCRFLLALLRGPRLLIYHLGAVMPLDWVTAQERLLERNLLVLSAIMAAILLTLGWRLRAGVLVPVRRLMTGIDAMEARRFDHRIVLQTGDEWERLATAFNGALEGMADLAVAQVIQKKLLPAGPVQAGGMMFQGRSVMMDMVGGDYFDAVPTADGRLAFVFADVAGHGVSAALVMAIAKSGFSSLIALGCTAPDEILREMNRLLVHTVKKRKAMTCLVGIAQADGEVRMAVAGQVPPVADDRPQLVPPACPSVPLGLFARIEPKTLTLRISPGQALVFYSDGAVTVTSPGGRPLGFQGMAEVLVRVGRASSPDFFDRTYQEIRTFSGSAPWSDDVTLAVLSRPNPEIPGRTGSAK